jgi:predicted nucleic acid-binding protein
MTIADTDVLVDFLSNRGEAARVDDLLTRGVLYTTVITRFELLSGAKNPRALARLMDLLDAVPALDLDTGAADAASEIRRSLEQAGLPIGMADSLIAGIVLSNGGTLLTRNLQHFERVQGLKLA